MSVTEAISPALSKRDTRREGILDVARAVFLAEGYAAASMSAIAAQVGGSKGTLYNYFKSKEELFGEVVSRHCSWQSEAMFSHLVDGLDVRSALTKVGREHLLLVSSDDTLAMFRLIVAESVRDPAVGKLFYESGPLRGINRLAGYLEQATARGELAVDDPETAAHLFIALCQNRMLKSRLCNYVRQPSKAAVEATVAQGVEVFMRAFGPAA
jgi:AcrR family transcriptional regulator